MDIGAKIDGLTKEQQQKYAKNLNVVQELGKKGHAVEVKTPDVVFIDSRWMIYLSDGRYQDLKTRRRDSFDDLKTLISKR